MEQLMKVGDVVKNFRETRLSTLKPPQEFVSDLCILCKLLYTGLKKQFDHRQISRPANLNEATTRITHNTRHFSGNYLIVILVLALYAIITNPILLVAIAFLFGGFAAINRFAPEPVTVGNQVITQKSLYIALFVIGLPLLWYASPVSTFFWLVGSSAILILGHASLMEPGVESEYTGVEGV